MSTQVLAFAEEVDEETGGGDDEGTTEEATYTVTVIQNGYILAIETPMIVERYVYNNKRDLMNKLENEL